MLRVIFYFFVRTFSRKPIYKGKFPFHTNKRLGDIIVSGVNDLKYIGKGKYILIDKDKSTKIDKGEALKLYLSQGALNQYVIRNGRPIAAKRNPNLLKKNRKKLKSNHLK
jgi:hypothetical protein